MEILLADISNTLCDRNSPIIRPSRMSTVSNADAFLLETYATVRGRVLGIVEETGDPSLGFISKKYFQSSG